MHGTAALFIAGCASPRLVETTPNGGCVAMADNSDSLAQL